MKFRHKVSTGTRFNQVYIPREFHDIFESGDLVEVRLIKKKADLFYSKNTEKLRKFKESIAKKIFSVLGKFKDIKQTYLFGSFLTKNIEYNDIDLLIVTENNNLEKISYNTLVKEINMKFHIISVSLDRLNRLLKICPITRSMLYYSVSNKPIMELPEREINEKHIRFLLMLPEDVLDVEVNSSLLYEALRRLDAIDSFLRNIKIDPRKIEVNISKIMSKELYLRISNNKLISKKQRAYLNTTIKKMLKEIYKHIR